MTKKNINPNTKTQETKTFNTNDSFTDLPHKESH